MEGGETPSLYTILPERHNERIGAAMMGSAHTYDIPPLPPMGRGGPGRPPLPPSAPSGMDIGGVELALNPEEVDLMDTDAMQARAEAALRENQVKYHILFRKCKTIWLLFMILFEKVLPSPLKTQPVPMI